MRPSSRCCPSERAEFRIPTRARTAITVEDFLTMSSPLECDDWNDALARQRGAHVPDRGLGAVHPRSADPRAACTWASKPQAPPYGRCFSYCTGGVFTAGRGAGAGDRHACRSLRAEKLFAPLGISDVSGYIRRSDVPQTGGGLRLRSRDLLKLAQLYLDGGSWHGKRIVTEAWVKTSTQPHAQIDEKTEYGYSGGCKSFSPARRVIRPSTCRATAATRSWSFPALDMVVVITSTNYNTRGMHEQTEKILTDYVLGGGIE